VLGFFPGILHGKILEDSGNYNSKIFAIIFRKI
jgi:hypothetical protein